MTEEVIDGGQEPQTPVYSDSEKQAMEQGWVPKDQWNGEGKWRDAESFLDRGELFSKIDHQKRELKQLKESMGEFKKHYDNVRETEYKRALQTLKAQKKEALREGDADLVVEIDDQIDDMRQAEIQAQITERSQPQSNGEEHPEFVNWKSRNSWYSNSADMREYADTYGAGLRLKGNSPSEVLRLVESAVKEKFASKFSNPNREKASAVEGSGAPGSGGKASTFSLSDDEKRMMNRIVATGVMTKEKYIADLKKIKSGE
jgi:hypothetical protein